MNKKSSDTAQSLREQADALSAKGDSIMEGYRSRVRSAERLRDEALHLYLLAHILRARAHLSDSENVLHEGEEHQERS